MYTFNTSNLKTQFLHHFLFFCLPVTGQKFISQELVELGSQKWYGDEH